MRVTSRGHDTQRHRGTEALISTHVTQGFAARRVSQPSAKNVMEPLLDAQHGSVAPSVRSSGRADAAYATRTALKSHSNQAILAR